MWSLGVERIGAARAALVAAAVGLTALATAPARIVTPDERRRGATSDSWSPPAEKPAATHTVKSGKLSFLVNGEGTGVLTAFLFNPTTYDPRPVSGVYPFGPVLNPNPLLAIDRFKHPQDINRFIGSAQARWNPIDRLTVSYTFGYDGYSLEQSEFFPRGSFPAAPASRRKHEENPA